MRMHHIVICGLSGYTVFFYKLSHKLHHFFTSYLTNCTIFLQVISQTAPFFYKLSHKLHHFLQVISQTAPFFTSYLTNCTIFTSYLTNCTIFYKLSHKLRHFFTSYLTNCTIFEGKKIVEYKKRVLIFDFLCKICLRYFSS